MWHDTLCHAAAWEWNWGQSLKKNKNRNKKQNRPWDRAKVRAEQDSQFTVLKYGSDCGKSQEIHSPHLNYWRARTGKAQEQSPDHKEKMKMHEYMYL